MGAGVRVGSLFTGVGGFDLGAERAGLEVCWQVENDRWCRDVLRVRFPETPLHEDVEDVDPTDLAPVELICGGFPCQDVSVAGKRAGLAGERSGLFYEFMRIARETAPRWLLIENVPGLLSSNGGRDMGAVIGTLAGLGYGYTWRVLDSQHFGLAQRRRRLFIVGHLGGFCPPEVLLEPSSVQGHPAEGGQEEEPYPEAAARVIGGSRRGVSGAISAKWAKGTGGPAGDEVYNLVPGVAPLQSARAGEGSGQGGSGVGEPGDPAFTLTGRDDPGVVYRKAQKAHDPEDSERWEEDDTAATLDAAGHAARTAHIGFYPTDGRFDHMHEGLSQPLKQSDPAGVAGPPLPRRLTPRECERLQGFPDDWTRLGMDAEGELVEISDSQRYRQMGNAVSVPVVEWIFRRIRQIHEAPGG